MDVNISPTAYSTCKSLPGDETVTAIFDEFWDWRLKTSPEFASYCGVHDYDDRLDDIGVDMFNDWQVRVKAFLDRCNKVDVKQISSRSQLDLILFKEELQTFLSGAPYNGWCLPINFLEGVHTDINLLLSFTDFDQEEDFITYIKRLKCYPAQVAQVRKMCEDGIKRKIVNHSASMQDVPGQIDMLINNGKLDQEKSTFLKPFNKEVKNIPSLDTLRREAVQVVEALLIPAFLELKDFIVNVYMKNVRPTIGISCLPDGTAHYQQCLIFHTSTNMTAQEVHDLGLSEVSRITKEIHKITQAEGFGTDTQAFMNHIKENKKFFYKSEDELLAGVRSICEERIRPKLSKLFKNIPSSKMIIQPAPESMSTAPVGFYMSGTNDGSRPGVYYINTSHVSDTPKYELVALSLHEGMPGHHLQGMYAVGQTHMPSFRQYIEDQKYSRAPARFSLCTAYNEGWGLYSESLGEELGVYADNFELFGRYSFEILRAARLVVDTGMHVMGWSLEGAQKYLEETSFMPEFFANSEIRRYITWPGQACAYKIGELKIKELRKTAEAKLGDKFDVRDFHDVILQCGPVPLNVLESMVTAYIDETKCKD